MYLKLNHDHQHQQYFAKLSILKIAIIDWTFLKQPLSNFAYDKGFSNNQATFILRLQTAVTIYILMIKIYGSKKLVIYNLAVGVDRP